MKAKIINTCILVTALLSAGSLNCLALDYDEAYAQISAQFSSQSSDLGNYDALKAQLPDVSGSFNIMSQADLDATMNSFSAEIQNKYQSSINSAQANAQSSSAEAMANISARAQSIQSGIDPDTGEAYSDYIANNTPSYDADAWLANATANLSSNISTLRGIVGDAEMPENELWAGVQDSYNQAVDSYNSMAADADAQSADVQSKSLASIASTIGDTVTGTVDSVKDAMTYKGQVQEGQTQEEALEAFRNFNTLGSSYRDTKSDLDYIATEQAAQEARGDSESQREAAIGAIGESGEYSYSFRSEE